MLQSTVSCIFRRFSPYIFLVIIVGLGIYVTWSLLWFAEAFGRLGDHSGIPVLQTDIFDAHNRTTPDPRTPIVPKILHRIFHNWYDPEDETSLREGWDKPLQKCMDLNPDWEFHLWTAKKSREFIAKEFPGYLGTYDSYKYGIQRVDSLRYFLLQHYGGIYQDMDNSCMTSLDSLLYLPAFTVDGGNGALSSNIMGGQPGHPWFALLVENLPRWNRDYYFPYSTIMFASGQWYVTAMWEKYHRLLNEDGTVTGFQGSGWGQLHRISTDYRRGEAENVFWTLGGGAGPWGSGDDRGWAMIGVNLKLIVVGAFALIAISVEVCVWCCRRRHRRRQDKRSRPRYELLPLIDGDEA